MKGFRTSCSFSFPELSCRKGRLLQGAVRGTEASPALSVPLHPPCRHLEPPPHRSRRRRRRLPLEGLSHRRAGPLEDDAASPARVHPPLAFARAAQGLPPHSPLWTLRQRQPRRDPALLGADLPAADPQQQSDILPIAPRVLPCPCPRCGDRMIVIEVFARGCKPRWRPTPTTSGTS